MRGVRAVPRLQILELPEGADDDRPPFILVVDQSPPQRIMIGPDQAPVADYWHDLADRIGARGVLVTPETIDIPANEVALAEGNTYPITVKVQPDLDDFRNQIEDAIREANTRATTAYTEITNNLRHIKDHYSSGRELPNESA
jgi:hypothetical protein